MKIFRVDTNTYYILTVINKSCFVKCKEYNGNLRLFYTEEEKTYANKLAVTIRTEDFACSDLEVKNIDVINGVPEAVFTKIACSCEIKLAAVLSIGILRDYLIIDCMFREVNLRGQKEPTYFLDGVSQHLNECLLKYRDSQEGFSELTIYFRNKGHLYQILHFLLRNIKDLIVVPLKCKSLLRLGKFQDDVHMYESQRTNSEEVHAFGDALLRHFDCVIDFHKAVLDNKDVPQDADVSDLYLSFRRSLTKHEYNTDFLYRKLLQNS